MRWNETQAPDPRPGAYYVSAANDSGGLWLMRGPFEAHDAALDAVAPTKTKAEELDPRAFWMAWGTVRWKDDAGDPPTGKMNGYFPQEVQ